jgi:hypothetical protein
MFFFGCTAFCAEALTFQDLMKPEFFPHAQHGMAVISSVQNKGNIEITTTGARILINERKGELDFNQRIGHPRLLAVMDLGSGLKGARITHATDGMVIIEIDNPSLTIRVNGDSLIMLHAKRPVTARIHSKIAPAWDASYKTDHILADKWGAFGLYCSDIDLNDNYNTNNPLLAEYALPTDAVLWLGVGPPKPYDWKTSLNDQVVWHWSAENAYPSDDALRSWKKYGNIVLLQSEMMLWKDWQLDFIPRTGVNEFNRVRNTIHEQNMRLIVYASPYYFLKGTSKEKNAMHNFSEHGFFHGVNSTSIGENMEVFLQAITRLKSDLKPDGFWFDGLYNDNPAAMYALMRRARDLLGEKGILEVHSTLGLGDGAYTMCYIPQVDAYADFNLRGENQVEYYSDAKYLRYYVSGYNISNSVGVLCNNSPAPPPTSKLVDNVLAANARMHFLAEWADYPDAVQAYHYYRSQLTTDLMGSVDR